MDKKRPSTARRSSATRRTSTRPKTATTLTRAENVAVPIRKQSSFLSQMTTGQLDIPIPRRSSTKSSVSAMSQKEEDLTGHKTYKNGAIRCPNNGEFTRCQLWKKPVAERIHKPAMVRNNKFIYEKFHYEYPEQDLFCPNCNMFFNSIDDYHNHLLMMDKIAPLMEQHNSYQRENTAIKAETRRMSLHINRLLVSDLMMPLIDKRRKKKPKTAHPATNNRHFKIDDDRIYYDPSKVEAMIVALKQKIELAKNVQLVNQMERSMVKKQNSIENVRKFTQERIRRLERQIKNLEGELTTLQSRAGKNTKSSAVVQLERKLDKLRDELNCAENEDETFEEKKRKTIVNHKRRMTIMQSKINLNETTSHTSKDSELSLTGQRVSITPHRQSQIKNTASQLPGRLSGVSRRSTVKMTTVRQVIIETDNNSTYD